MGILSNFWEKFYSKKVLDGVSSLIKMRRKNAKWEAGKDWVQYSGPFFDEKEYKAAIESLMTEWLIFGKKGREFELEFANKLDKEFI